MADGIRRWFERLIDDAAWFPPGNLPLADAVPAHDAHLQGPQAYLVGPLLVPDTQLPAAAELVAGRDPLPVHLVVAGGAGAIGPALTYAGRVEGLDVRALEAASRDDDLAAGVRRIVAMVASGSEDDVEVWVELPPLDGDRPTPGWLTALDEVAANGFGCKYRTGGPDAHAFPTEAQLAAVIDASLDREVTVKLTAGLHRAVRHRGPDSFEHHGFVNVLVAFDTAREGGAPEDVARLLASTDGDALAEHLRDRISGAAGVRRSFASFGSCSVLEPFDDLRALGLVEESDR